MRSLAKVNVDSLRSKCSKISCYTARNITPCLFYIVRFNLLLSEALKPPNVSQRGQKLLGLRPRSLLTSFRHIWRLLSPRQTQISPDNVKGKAEYCYQCNKILFLYIQFMGKRDKKLSLANIKLYQHFMRLYGRVDIFLSFSLSWW